MTELNQIFRAVAEVAPHISSGMLHRREYVGEENPSDEKQMEADVWANELIKEKLTSMEIVGQYASEEEHELTECGEGVSVSVDPLDGSSNIPTNNLVGTIVGVYDEDLPAEGGSLIGSFYIVYGPLTSAIVAENGKVDEYIIEEAEGDEVKTVKVGEDIELPEPTVYGFGGNKEWFEDFRTFENELSEELKLRYGGSLVGDVNQVIHHGGLFGYPGKKSAPEGKYRLQFESIPIGYVFHCLESAKTSNGSKSIMDMEIDELHQRSKFFVGNKQYIERLEQEVQS